MKIADLGLEMGRHVRVAVSKCWRSHRTLNPNPIHENKLWTRKKHRDRL